MGSAGDLGQERRFNKKITYEAQGLAVFDFSPPCLLPSSRDPTINFVPYGEDSILCQAMFLYCLL